MIEYATDNDDVSRVEALEEIALKRLEELIPEENDIRKILAAIEKLREIAAQAAETTPLTIEITSIKDETGE